MPSKSLVAAALRPFVLAILDQGPEYGYQIIKRITDATDGHVTCTTGTLYPLLHTMENQGYLSSFWQPAEEGPKRKFYRITDIGRTQLKAERLDWMRVNSALSSLWGSEQQIQPS